MLRLTGIILAALCSLACHRVPEPASRFNVSDSRRGLQLLSGVYAVEQPGWRWAARQFSIALKPPPGSATRGGRLWLRMYVPKEQIEEIGPMTLTATIDDYQMAPETFSSGGSVTFSRDLPPQLLDTNILPVQFSFDRAAPPSARDSRELGMVLSDVGLDTR